MKTERKERHGRYCMVRVCNDHTSEDMTQCCVYCDHYGVCLNACKMNPKKCNEKEE